MKRSYAGVILSMLAVFGSGILVGAFAYHSYTVKTVTATVEPPSRPSPEEWRRKYVAELENRLKLDQAQVGSLNAVLDDTKARFNGLKARHKQEADMLKSEQTEKVRTLLRPEQVPEYENFRRERDERMKARQAALEKAKQQTAK